MKNSLEIDKYINGFPSETREKLDEVRQFIWKLVPSAQEIIAYGIPTFEFNGKNLIHYAGYKHHIGFYPTASGIVAFKKKIGEYKSSKGAVQFPLDKPLPLDLIKLMVMYRVKTIMENEPLG